MNSSENCKEIFLKGVIGVSLYSVANTSFSVPYSVAQILNIDNVTLPTPVLNFSLSDTNALSVDSLSAKTTFDRNGNGIVYSFEIAVNFTQNASDLNSYYKDITGQDYYVVVTTADDSLYLCYTLPGTFYMTAPAKITQGEWSTTSTITLKAISDFIPIMLKP